MGFILTLRARSSALRESKPLSPQLLPRLVNGYVDFGEWMNSVEFGLQARPFYKTLKGEEKELRQKMSKCFCYLKMGAKPSTCFGASELGETFCFIGTGEARRCLGSPNTKGRPRPRPVADFSKQLDAVAQGC